MSGAKWLTRSTKDLVLNIPFNGESQIQSPRTNTGLGAGSSPLGPGLCPVMRGCLPPTHCACVCVAPSSEGS